MIDKLMLGCTIVEIDYVIYFYNLPGIINSLWRKMLGDVVNCHENVSSAVNTITFGAKRS